MFGPRSGYVSNPTVLSAARSVTLDRELIALCDKKGRKGGIGGDVKMIYVTKAGPGPITRGEDESLIDLNTGLNKYKPARKGGFGCGSLIKFGLAAAAVGLAVEMAKKRK